MWKFFDQIYRYLMANFTEVELIDAGTAKHYKSSEGIQEGAQGVFRIDLEADEIHFRDVDNFAHNDLYKHLESQLMRQHRYIESFEITTRKDMIIVSIYYKAGSKRQAKTNPTVTRVLLLEGWYDGHVFRDLPSALRELGGDLILASRTIPAIRSFNPDEGKASVRLETVVGSRPAETIELQWMREGRGIRLMAEER